VTRKFPYPAKLRICLLAVAVLMQTFCAIHVSASAETLPAAPASGCHDETPDTPAAPAKCCVMQDMLKASLPARFSLPESPMAHANSVQAQFDPQLPPPSFSISLLFSNGWPPAFAILRV